MDLKLKNKNILITGATKGIGLTIAEKFAGEGANIIFCARDYTLINKIVKKLKNKYKVNIFGKESDISKSLEIEKFVNELKKSHNSIDVLINNAGAGSNETILDSKDEEWQYYWDLHVMSVVRMTRLIVPLMKKVGGGVILNNASICATQPLWYEPIYNVTKSALVMLSKNLSNELIKDNIRVNCINAGLTLTPDWISTAKKLTKNKKNSWKKYIKNIADENTPIKRFASTDEIANIFLFLSSECASYCVGSTYYVDGGMLKVIK